MYVAIPVWDFFPLVIPVTSKKTGLLFLQHEGASLFLICYGAMLPQVLISGNTVLGTPWNSEGAVQTQGPLCHVYFAGV